MLTIRFDVGVDTAGADRCRTLAVQCLLEVVFMVPGAKVGRVAFVLVMIALGTNDRFLKVSGNKTIFPRVQEGLVDGNVAVQLVGTAQ